MTDCPGYRVFAWSGGYVAFTVTFAGEFSDGTEVMKAYSSSDGIHWNKPRVLVNGDDNVMIDDLEEGPDGILAVGHVARLGTCSGPVPDVEGLWFSSDGISWTNVSLSRFNGSPYEISGSARGFLATGGWGYPQVWTSPDGLNWTDVTLPFSIYRNANVGGPVAFTSGYLIYGSVIVPGGCGGDGLEQSAIWFSSDAKGWVRAVLPNVGSAAWVDTNVWKASETTLVADETGYNVNSDVLFYRHWVSTDGLTWTQIPANSVLNGGWNLLHCGTTTLAYNQTTDDSGKVTAEQWAQVGSDWTVRQLIDGGDPVTDPAVESGDLISADAVLGPTGLLIVLDGQVWFGVLSA